MEEGCSTQKQVLNYLGERFRVKLSLPDWYPNEQAAEFLFKYVCFCLHCFLWRGSRQWFSVLIVVTALVGRLGLRTALRVGLWPKEGGASSVSLAILTFSFYGSFILLYCTFTLRF